MKKLINPLLITISLITIASGIAQIIAPAFVLSKISLTNSTLDGQLFATIGMFMAIFGTLLLHALYSPFPNRAAVLWCAVQKFGACVAVIYGVHRELFNFLALAVAIFDFFSGILIAYHYLSSKRA
ncbi:patatin [Dyadobacter sandarakinus]|nr:patatin [Dyadobacter sandarakinus]